MKCDVDYIHIFLLKVKCERYWRCEKMVQEQRDNIGRMRERLLTLNSELVKLHTKYLVCSIL